MQLGDKWSDVGEAIDNAMRRRAAALFILYSIVFFLWTGFLAHLRLLWFDEFITLYVIRFHSLAELVQKLKTGMELNPPLFHLLTRVSTSLFGESAIALRLPAMIGFWIMTVCTYVFVQRRTSPLFGAVAALFTLATTSYLYAFEARPYGIVLGCCGISMVAWQSATDGRNRRIALLALTASLATAVSCHYYAGLLALPLVAGELVRTESRRRLDIPVWVAMIAGVSSVFIYLPLIRAGFKVHNNEHVWNKPQISFSWESYWTLLGYVCIPFVAALAFLWWKRLQESRGNTPSDTQVPFPEIVASSVLAGLPIIALAAASSITNMITERYVVSAILGSAILFSFTCWKIGNNRISFGFGTLLLLIVFFAIGQVRKVESLLALRNYYSSPALNATLASKDVPIVVKGLDSMPFQYYAAEEFRSRAVAVVDFERMYRFSSVDTVDRLLVLGQGTFPIKVRDYQGFRRENPHFLIFGGPVGWIEDAVIAEGGTVRVAYWDKEHPTVIFAADCNRSAAQTSGTQSAANSPEAEDGGANADNRQQAIRVR